MGGARQVQVTNRQRTILQRLIDAKKTAQEIAARARIVLMSADGIPNADQAEVLDIDRQRVRRWRGRWADREEALGAAEARAPAEKELEELIIEALSDAYRSGAPQRFSAEQVAQVLALACEAPADIDVPTSHWTPADLTRELLKRGVFETISPRSVDRFFERRRIFGRTKWNTGCAPRKPVPNGSDRKPSQCATSTLKRLSYTHKARGSSAPTGRPGFKHWNEPTHPSLSRRARLNV